MFKWLFGKKCEHDFKILKTIYNTYWDGDACRYMTSRKYILYCPKCDKEKRVYADDYDLRLEKQRMKDGYTKR